MLYSRHWQLSKFHCKGKRMDSQIQCPNCNRLIKASSTFCNYCGFDLRTPPSPPPQQMGPPPGSPQYATYPPPPPPRTNAISPGCIAACVIAVVIGGFLMLVAIALPNFIRVKDKAKEAETKQNCHAMQLALERYAVDHPDGLYPVIIMGGDWTDTYAVWQEWVDAQPTLSRSMIADPGRQAAWQPAAPDAGDPLIMESYLPSYPGNPFIKQQPGPPQIHHYPCPRPCPGTPPFWRTVGGRDSNKMFEVFGPVWLNPGQSIAGDYYVHHMFNDPPYDYEGDVYKEPPRGWTNPSCNKFLSGNFSYYPRLGTDSSWSLDPDPTCTGYTLAGYGSLRTAGQDVYNRNGNYKGRYRTESCLSDRTDNYYPDDIPCMVNAGATPTLDFNNGGSDTLQDGVVIVLDSGVERKISQPYNGPDCEESEGY